MKDCSLEMANIVCEMAGKPNSCKLCSGRKSGCFTIPKMQKLTSAGYGDILFFVNEIREYVYKNPNISEEIKTQIDNECLVKIALGKRGVFSYEML